MSTSSISTPVLQLCVPAIAGIEVVETIDKDGNPKTITKYRLLDKGRSLERLGRYLAMYQEPGDKTGEGLSALAGVMTKALEMKRKLLESVNAD